MNRIRTFLAAAAVAIGATTLAAEPAKAQTTPTPVIEFKTVGGFVIYNYDVKIYSTGFTVCALTAPREPGETLFMYNYLTRGQLVALQNAFTRAHFSQLPSTVRTRAMIADVPDRVITFRGKTGTFTTMGMGSAPVATPTFVTLVTQLGNVFTRISEEPLVDFVKTGGIAGLHDALTINRAGVASFSRSRQAAQASRLSFAEVNELKRLIVAADWFTQPDFFPQIAMIADAFEYSIGVFNPRQREKTIRWNDGSQPPAVAEAVLAKVEDIAREVNR